MRKWSKWLIFVPVAIIALFAPTANAEPVAGLNAVGYNFYGLTNGGYPTPSDTLYPVCHTEIENNINRNFNGEPFGSCPYDYFMVHYSGFITIPENNTIQFMIAADDGGTIQIGNTQFGGWNQQFCQWSAATTASFPAGSYALNGWFFEWWGDTCFMLAWNINNTGWAIVPDEAFTIGYSPTTTTTIPETTTTSTTTTTTTTTTIPVTTLPQTTTTTTTTTEPPTTTSASTTTSSTTTTSSVPQTTSTQSSTTTTSAPLPQSSTTTYSVVPSTTTTGFVSPTTSELPVVVIPLPTEEPVEELPLPQPSTDVVSTPEIVITIPDAVVDAILPTIITPDALLDAIGSDLSDPTVELPTVSNPITDEALNSIIENAFTPDASPEEIVDALTEILGSDLTEEQFTTVMETVFSEEASVEQMSAAVDNLLDANLSTEELTAVFESAFDSDLSDAETVALAEELLSKPLDDKEFGAVINAIFDEKVSDEVLVETFSAILTSEISDSKFAEVVNVLENATITNEQVAQVVDLVLTQADGVSEGQATELAMSPKVLESVSEDQATEVFDAIVATALSLDEGASIVDAISQASTDVKQSFETELNVFEGVFDMYLPLGSQIPVSQRRTLLAVSLGALATAVGTRVRR